MNVRSQVITETQEEALTDLRISLHTDMDGFMQACLLFEGAMYGTPGYFALSKYNEAIKKLAEIEDSIKRFREGHKQAFEE